MPKKYSQERLIALSVVCFLLGFIIGGTTASMSVLEFCVEKGVALLDIEGYELNVNENVATVLITKGILKPENINYTLQNRSLKKN